MDGSLLEFQLAEIFDSIWSVFCALLFVLWIYATFFMQGDK